MMCFFVLVRDKNSLSDCSTVRLMVGRFASQFFLPFGGVGKRELAALTGEACTDYLH